jgi:hypothetical protein
MPEPRTILVTFCNVTSGAPALGLFDADRATIEVLRTPEARSEQGGVTGVALNDEFLFLATSRMSGPRQATVPAGPSGIFTLDRRDLSLRAVHTCATVFDAHSLWLDGDSLLVVSTGTDAVVRLGLDGPRVVSEENVWRPEPAGPPTDVHHLNAIYNWRGRRLVAGFGVKSGTQWSSATDGFIVNIASGERLVSGVRQPHSMVAAGDALAYCESANGTVRLVGRSDERTLPGFTRGLCTAGDGLFAATSRGRRVSKSTGALTSRS